MSNEVKEKIIYVFQWLGRTWYDFEGVKSDDIAYVKKWRDFYAKRYPKGKYRVVKRTITTHDEVVE